MVDKLHSYQGTVGQLHTIRDNVKNSWESWKEKKEQTSIPEFVKKFASNHHAPDKSYGSTAGNRPDEENNLPSDYSYIYRKKTNFELFRLSAAVCGIEFSYAAITAFVSPILLSVGASYEVMTLSWSISPIIGFFLSPILGTLSDQCKLKYGRRRPFIILLSILVVIGLTLIPNGALFASLVVDDDSDTPTNQSIFRQDSENVTALPTETAEPSVKDGSRKTWTIAFIMIGLALTDFASDSLQSPSRAYLLDLCTKDEESRGLSTFTILAGAGGCIGYLMGSVDWDDNGIGSFLGGQVHAVFTIYTIVFIVCILTTITTFPEVPLEDTEHYNMKKKLHEISVDESKRKQSVKSQTSVSSYHGVSQVASPQHVAPVNGIADVNHGTVLEGSNAVPPAQPSTPENKKTPSLKDYMLSIVQMPYSLKILYLTNLLCWMSHVGYSLYFTDFVAETVFEGDPKAPIGSESKNLYSRGVRYACLGMSVYSLSCLFNSFLLEFFLRRFGLKTVYTANLLIDSLSQFILFILNDKVCVIVLSWASGVLYCTIFTLPYMVIAQYHTNNAFEFDEENNPIKTDQIRGLGTDVAIISSCVFPAQFILSSCMGKLMHFFTARVVPLCSSAIAFLAALISTKVIYLEQ